MILEAIVFPSIDPAAITLPLEFDLFGQHWGPFPLRWYALAYIAGLLLGWRWMVYLVRKARLWAPGKPAMSVGQVDDFLFWATIGVILGGRLGYVLFYKPDLIWKSPFEIIQIWNGGMSFHGGLIGVALAAYWFTRQIHVDQEKFDALAKKSAVAEPPADKKSDYIKAGAIGWLKKTEYDELQAKARTQKLDLLRLGDLAAAATPIGLFFGRIANFINGELWGRETTVPWGMIFCNDRICTGGQVVRHPSQLYEAALEGIVLFAIINYVTLKHDSLKRPGMNIGLFLVCYGFFRFVLEFVREPDAHMPPELRGIVTMGMLLSIPMILVGAWLLRRALVAPTPAAKKA